MKLVKTALAGTLESSDVQITLAPAEELTIELHSPVAKRFGDQIKQVIQSTLATAGIKNAYVKVVDQGALDCVIKARTEAAIHRAADMQGDIDWEVLA